MDIEEKDELETNQNQENKEIGQESYNADDSIMPQNTSDQGRVLQIKGMFDNYYLDYASYVILDRAVPAIEDGLKPVQRRILHSMDELDDGRFNKVANIVGNTMKYHPHGDAAIADALVQIAQRNLLIDMQGNFGNILTGDRAAASRYIEARLSKFAKEVVFNPKTTDWTPTYDGRNKEPITLSVKFPLLLAQGGEGIAVVLACKFLPHNFNELIDASVAYLRDEPFVLLPDFPTGGLMDASNYNDGLRGGKVRVRAKISRLDQKTLVIKEIPYGTTTGAVIESIVQANEKGKIKIKKVDDNTAQNCEILIYLAPGVSPDQTIDALYAFTKCQVSSSPNACVIRNDKPEFLGVSEILKYNTDHTMHLLSRELEILLDELNANWHWISLEKLFFEKRIYKVLENDSNSWEDQVTEIEREFDPYRSLFKREISRDDVLKLCDKPVRKISKFDIKKADEQLADIEAKIQAAKYNLEHIVDYTIDYFLNIKKKYGKGRERKTEIRSFHAISAVSVAANNEKLYVNKEEGFLCTSAGLKKEKDKEKYEFVRECSDMDDVIVFCQDGTFVVLKLQQKVFVGPNIIHADIFHKNDDRTVYNMIYRDGKAGGAYYVKRFAVKGITRDKVYDLTAGTPDSKVIYFTSNPNAEAEIIRVSLRPRPKLKKTSFEYDFATLAIKGRSSRGNLLTKFAVKEIKKREDGVSTLGAREIFYDVSVNHLNADGRGESIGAYSGNDKILQLFKNGEFKLSGFDLSTHFDDDMVRIKKYDPEEIFTVIYREAETQKLYLKRFSIEEDTKMNVRLSFVGENPDSQFLHINMDKLPRLLLSFKVSDAGNTFDDEEVNVSEFIAVKSYKAKGKRLATKEIDSYEFLEPYEPEIEEIINDISEEMPEEVDTETTSQQLLYDDDDDKRKWGDDSTIQGSLFDDLL